MDSTGLTFRGAEERDLPVIVALLADDPLGALREAPGDEPSPAYLSAFRAIEADSNHELLVGDLEGRIVAVLQLSIIPHLTYEGGWRGQIEGVRVAEDLRSLGVGRLLVDAAVCRARDRGCHLVQLTTDRRRPEALRFYTGLGFQATHDGLKLHLTPGELGETP